MIYATAAVDNLAQLEQENLQREREWLLRDEFTSLMETITETFNEFSDAKPVLIDGSAANTKYGVPHGETLALSVPQSEILKGYVKLQDGELIKGDIVVRIPSYRRAQPVHFAINLLKPYHIQQVSMIRSAAQVIRKHFEFTCPGSAQDAIKYVEMLIRKFQDALVILSPDAVMRFPDKVPDFEARLPACTPS